jgi:hypothetical protein
VVEAIVTWYPADVMNAETILFVVVPVSPLMPALVWYTQVLPTATGNGIELAATNAFWVVLGDALEGALLTGLAVEARGVEVDEVRPSVWLGTSGAVPADTLHPASRLHPARVMMATPARTALADPRLLM